MRRSQSLSWVSFCLISCVLLASPSAADECAVPVYGGTITFGGSDSVAVNGLVLKGDGGSIITGSFKETVDFDPGPREDVHVSNGGQDAFVSSLAADGAHVWTHTFGGSEFDSPDNVAIDADGSIFVAGTYSSTVDFDPTDGVDEHLSSREWDGFISKYLSDGTYVWTRTVGGEGFDRMLGVAMAGDGGVLVTGFFQDEVDFDPGDGEDERSSHGDDDTFLLKLTSNGDYVWTLTFGDNGLEFGRDVVVGADASIVLVGAFTSDETDFDPSDDKDIHFSTGQVDAYVSKYSGGGTYEWTRTYGGSEITATNDVAVSSTGGVFVCGQFTGDKPVDFDPTEGVDERLSHGDADIVVSALTGDGSYLWTWTAGAEEGEAAFAIAVNEADRIFVTGHFGVTDPGYAVDFDQAGSGDVHVTNGEDDVFVTMLEADGSYGWTRTFGAAECDLGVDIAVGLEEQLVVAGSYRQTVDFDPDGDGDEHTSNGYSDAYVTTFLCSDEVPCEGDANGDGLVDPLDSGFVLARFGCEVGAGDPSCDTADMNGDSLIDPLDVGFILARFGTCQ